MIKHTGNKFYKFSVKAIDMQLYPVYELFKGKKLLEETEGGNKK